MTAIFIQLNIGTFNTLIRNMTEEETKRQEGLIV
ncbi:hypothetical protein GGQ95_002440 [Anoxybacillus rupiensis]|nr:hypothetical protein [Anoxybacillus rupiensis]